MKIKVSKIKEIIEKQRAGVIEFEKGERYISAMYVISEIKNAIAEALFEQLDCKENEADL